MKKAIALLLALIMLFSTVCAGVNAVDAEPEQTDGKVETEEGRIILTDDELTEKFGIEKILLPEGFEPVAYVYYDGDVDGELPEYLTLCFSDGTDADVKNDFGNLVNVNDLIIEVYFYYAYYHESLVTVITIKETNKTMFFIDYDCEYIKQPFSENLKRHFENISECIAGLIKGENPGFSEYVNLDGYYYSLEYWFYKTRRDIFKDRHYFFDGFIFDINCLNMLFVRYCFTEVFPVLEKESL